MLGGMDRGAGRYAPSPTGRLHLGNLRTALLAWCFARSRGAPFLVRIEDLDEQRSRREYEATALADLAALGIDWDGEVVRQSERRDRHRDAFERLRADGRLYRCWCSRAEIREAVAAPHGPHAAYPGTCRRLSERERAQRERSGRPCAWRFDAGAVGVSFDDAVAGSQGAVVDDFVVWREGPRGAQTAAYNLAVVVDDADQGVGEVVRGDDLLETTPRQIALGEALAVPIPRYAHVPLVLWGEGRRLAKRRPPAGVPATLPERLARGERIEALVGWMASSAGLVPPGTELDARELLARFSPARLRREPALLDAGDAGLSRPPRTPRR